MENTVQKIPFLRPAVALAFGIFIGSLIELQIYYLLGISLSLLVVNLIINRRYNFRLSTFFGVGIQLLFISIGLLTFEIYNEKPPFINDGVFTATLLEKPQEKKNSYKTVVRLSSVKSGIKRIKSNEQLLVYFNKTEEIQQLSAGDNIIFSASPQAIKNYGNPYEFDYKNYLEKKRIYRQVYLSANNWKKTSINSNSTLIIYAEQFREKLLEIYRSHIAGKHELEILSALTLGYKRELDPETKRIFSNSGAMHVLAVSGLHVGIVFWIITLLFGKFRKQKAGKIIFIILSILTLWTYAFITGLSPSVMRAAGMFSIFVVGDNINRKANSYNSLAASALFLLLVNPNNLFEVGFQLSYMAVFGILFLHPKISKLFLVKNIFLKFIWNLTCISIAAQIATFPITSFYFNQFPIYFLITNLIVIPAAMILIPLGLSLLLFSKISVLALIISKTIQFIIDVVYGSLSQIEKFPFSVQEISILPIQLFFIIGVLVGLLLFLKFNRTKFLKGSLVFVLLLSVSVFYQNIKQNGTVELIVYNTSKTPVIQLINGKHNYVISELNSIDSLQILASIKNTNIKNHLHPPIFISSKDTFKNQHLLLKNGLLFFNEKVMIINKSFSNISKTISADFIINPKQFNTLEEHLSTNTTIITNKRFKQHSKPVSKAIYQLPLQGAFKEKW